MEFTGKDAIDAMAGVTQYSGYDDYAMLFSCLEFERPTVNRSSLPYC